MAEGAPFKKQLAFEALSYSQLSPQAGVTGLLVEKERLVSVFGGDPSAFVAAFRLGDKKFLADMTFEIPPGERITFDKRVPSGHWRGLIPVGKERLLFLDGAGGSLMAVEGKAMKFLSHRQIIVDLIRPAGDSRGEPTARETAAMRKRFTKHFLAAQGSGLVFTGIVPLPRKWGNKDGAKFLLATRVTGFPVVTMRCNENDVTQCQLERACDLGGWRPKDAVDVAGLAYSEKSDEILIADRRDHSLRVFQASSCAHSPYRGDLRLPEKLKSPTNIAVDDDGRLWVTTERPDDYRNGSVFMWEKW